MTRLLIANRGEIAARICRTAQDMGITVIAVYSDVDANAPHVLQADEAYHLGAGPVGESYLNQDRVITAINETKADLVHPGYGFLSENPDFREAINTETSAKFVGPPTHAIRAMGDKAEAKRLMAGAGVPLIPGYNGEDQSDDRLIKEAETIGYPLMVKAAAGGGGRGIRKVYEAASLKDAIESARSEASRAFANDTLLLEKLVENAAHVEVQVLSDGETTWHLGERDCSMQRRHQKVVEEAPSPRVGQSLRKAMGLAAVNAAKAVDYEGAGTVEFLLDDSENFYFLEMNTRLQVEHPVTEEITGLDLVELQLRIALGEKLDLSEEPDLEGHAIEVRLYAEDPFNGFTPEIGDILHMDTSSVPNARIDSGVDTGSSISPYYDPMIAKLIAYGDTREEARENLKACVESISLLGVRTNRAYLMRLLDHQSFIDGRATTGLLDDESDELTGSNDQIENTVFAITAATITADKIASSNALRGDKKGLMMGLATGVALEYPVFLDAKRLDVIDVGAGTYRCRGEGESTVVTLSDDGTASVGDITYPFEMASVEDTLHAMWGPHYAVFKPRRLTSGSGADDLGDDAVIAPSHATVRKVSASPGDTVTKGTALITIEAMKMETVLKAPRDGVIDSVNAAEGDEIRKGTVLITLKEEGA